MGCIPCTQRLPSCVGLEDGKQPFPGFPWKQQYVVCDKDRTTTVNTCQDTKIFNPNTKQCIDVKDLTKRKLF